MPWMALWRDRTVLLVINAGPFPRQTPRSSAMRFRTLAAFAASAVTALAGTAALVPAANADVAPYHTYRITTTASLALDVEGGATGNGASVIQWPLNGGSNQEWRVLPSSVAGYQMIQNVNSDKCLTLPFQGDAGTGLNQYGCDANATDQQWAIDSELVNGWGGHLIYSGLQNGNAVDVPGGTIDWGTQIVAWPFHHGVNQTFYFNQLD
jgi:hypothetical protein